MKKFHLHSVTNASAHQQQLCKEDYCYVVMAKTIADVLLSGLLPDILLLSSKLRNKHWKTRSHRINILCTVYINS